MVTNFYMRVGGARGVMEMDSAIRIQTLDEVDCISHCTNTLRKGINTNFLTPAKGK